MKFPKALVQKTPISLEVDIQAIGYAADAELLVTVTENGEKKMPGVFESIEDLEESVMGSLEHTFRKMKQDRNEARHREEMGARKERQS